MPYKLYCVRFRGEQSQKSDQCCCHHLDVQGAIFAAPIALTPVGAALHTGRAYSGGQQAAGFAPNVPRSEATQAMLGNAGGAAGMELGESYSDVAGWERVSACRYGGAVTLLLALFVVLPAGAAAQSWDTLSVLEPPQ